MTKTFVFLFMLFMHVFADFNLQQPLLKDLKQKSFWEKETKNMEPGDAKRYLKDWMPALLCHSVQWTFCVMFPIALYLKFQVGPSFVLWFVINTALHFVIDHLKCNVLLINLIVDQMLHLVCIQVTFNFLLIL